MKEKYIKPDSYIQKFAAVDVITTSGGGDEPIVTPPDWNDKRVKESRFYVLTPFIVLSKGVNKKAIRLLIPDCFFDGYGGVPIPHFF